MSHLKTEISNLNSEQLTAVEHGEGPLLIFAGAGSGKTRVITYRIARLIEKGVEPYRILAVTFTNKAANEMRSRVNHLVGEKSRYLWMGTFHSVCGRILRQSGKEIGIDSNFVIYDDSDQLAVVKNLLKQNNIDDKSIAPRAILYEISRAKEVLRSPNEYQQVANSYFEQVVAKLYPKYQKNLSQNNALDFDDMIVFTVKLLNSSENARERYQNQFEYLLVDEFQDVNHSQYELIKILSNKRNNITIVGDDDQSIYAWRGADVSHILSFASDYPNSKVVKLEQNYRSTNRILIAANEVIKHNRTRAPKKLWTNKQDGELISQTEMGTEQDEAMLVADTIKTEVLSKKRNYSDYAVLYRTNAQSRVLEEAFLMMRIPHVLIGGQRFYERKEIKDMIAYLRVVLNPNDSISLKRIINVPSRGIGETTISKAESRISGMPLFDVISDENFQMTVSSKTKNSIKTFLECIKLAQAFINTGRTEPVLRQVLNLSGYMDALRAEGSEDAFSRLDNLQELVNVALQHDETAEEPGLSSFLQEISLLSDADSLNDSNDAVTLMTIHTAKGLEFPIVFMVGMEEGVFPHIRSMQSDSEIEEERRLCYVGMTRAMEELHLLHAAKRTTYGQTNFNSPSRFLANISEEYKKSLRETPIGNSYTGRRPSATLTQELERKPLRSPSWTPPFEVGQQVSHAKFGIGVVVSCMPVKEDCEVTVAFPGVVGIKKMMQNFAKLTAV